MLDPMSQRVGPGPGPGQGGHLGSSLWSEHRWAGRTTPQERWCSTRTWVPHTAPPHVSQRDGQGFSQGTSSFDNDLTDLRCRRCSLGSVRAVDSEPRRPSLGAGREQLSLAQAGCWGGLRPWHGGLHGLLLPVSRGGGFSLFPPRERNHALSCLGRHTEMTGCRCCMCGSELCGSSSCGHSWALSPSLGSPHPLSAPGLLWDPTLHFVSSSSQAPLGCVTLSDSCFFLNTSVLRRAGRVCDRMRLDVSSSDVFSGDRTGLCVFEKNTQGEVPTLPCQGIPGVRSHPWDVDLGNLVTVACARCLQVELPLFPVPALLWKQITGSSPPAGAGKEAPVLQGKCLRYVAWTSCVRRGFLFPHLFIYLDVDPRVLFVHLGCSPVRCRLFCCSHCSSFGHWGLLPLAPRPVL